MEIKKVLNYETTKEVEKIEEYIKDGERQIEQIERRILSNPCPKYSDAGKYNTNKKIKTRTAA